MTEETDKYKGLVLEPQREGIELERNTRGFNWKIKIMPAIPGLLMSSDINRLEDLNKQMNEKFGVGE